MHANRRTHATDAKFAHNKYRRTSNANTIFPEMFQTPVCAICWQQNNHRTRCARALSPIEMKTEKNRAISASQLFIISSHLRSLHSCIGSRNREIETEKNRANEQQSTIEQVAPRVPTIVEP